jgi:RNA polymerase sigma factor (sigma-70 family)
MPTSPIGVVIRYLRGTLVPEAADLTDGQLLECFLSRQEPAALEVLVRRHGPMVWGVCRRILQNHHDAEDAFQATFLVLARKAASIHSPAKVGNWLYGVAHQTALKARATRAKRKSREMHGNAMREPGVTEHPWSEVEPVLDQELSRLPERYRTVIVLCGLEGKTVKEAARHLRVPQGTIASRLARGRAMLARRLARHGIKVSGGALAAVLSDKVVFAALPSSVLTSTIKAMTLATAGQAVAAGLVSSEVAALTEGMVKSMLLTKLKIAMVVVLGFAITSAAASRLYVLAHGVELTLAREPGQNAETGDNLAQPDDASRGTSIEKAPGRTDQYGDPLPDGALARLGTTRFRLGAPVALSPDGKTVVTTDGTFWDVATGQLIRRVKGRGQLVCYSPDGRLVAFAHTAYQDNNPQQQVVKVEIWDAATAKRLAELPVSTALGLDFSGRALSLGFSPDSSILAVGGAEMDSKQGKAQCFIGLWRWDGTRLKPLWDAKPGQPTPQHSPHTSLAFSSDGRYLATGDFLSNVIRIWKVDEGKEIRQLKCSGTDVSALAFAPLAPRSREEPTDNALASGNKNGAVALWDPENGTKHWENKQAGEVWALAFAPDGKTLAVGSVSQKQYQPVLVLLDVRSGKETHRLATGRQPSGRDGVRSVAFSKDGKVLAAIHGIRLRLWEGTTGKERPGPPGPDESIPALAISEDGRTAATAGLDCSVILWDPASGKEKLRLKGHDGPVVGVRFVPGGKLLASAGSEHDQTVRVWDLATGDEVRRLKANPQGTLYALAVSPDGKLLAACEYSDGGIYVWDTATGQLLHTLRNGEVLKGGVARLKQQAADIAAGVDCLAFSPDGKVLAAGEHTARGRKNSIVLWNALTGKKLRDFPVDNEGVISVSFALDGHLLASTGFSNPTIDFWDVDSGEKLFDLPCPPRGVVTFSPDGKSIAQGLDKEPIRLWEIASRRFRCQFSGSGAVGMPFPQSLAFSRDGRMLLSAKGCTALVWDVTGLHHGGKTAAMLSPEKMQALWQDLASPDAAQAARAIWSLGADPKRAVPFLAQHLRDVPGIDCQRIRPLIADLDSNDFKVREAAEKQLRAFGKLAEPALREVIARKVSLEASQRIRRLLQKREVNMPAGMWQGLRAIEVLEHAATAEARAVLEHFAKGTQDDYYRYEAQAAALRLKKRPPAGE